jgi:SlyX protein
MKSDAERLTDLEVVIAEQEKTIAELSGELAEQWKVVEALRKTVERLADRLLSIEEQTAPDIPVTRPPHW